MSASVSTSRFYNTLVERRSIEAVIAALNAAEVRYLIAGGLAVVAHGYLRTTKDLDIVLALDRENAGRGVRCLAALGFRPTVPVPIDDFAEELKREEWAREKDATVLRLYSDEHRSLPIDLFMREPFDFGRAYRDALQEEIAPGQIAWFVSLADLLAMKRAAGRPQDLADVRQLEEIQARIEDEEER